MWGIYAFYTGNYRGSDGWDYYLLSILPTNEMLFGTEIVRGPSEHSLIKYAKLHNIKLE